MSQEEKRIGFELKIVNNLIRRRLSGSICEAELAHTKTEEFIDISSQNPDPESTEKIGQCGIMGMQVPIIGYICEHSREGDVFQKNIEQEFNIRRSTATVMLQSLEQKGYLLREPVEYDARLKRIVLTPKAIKHDEMIRKRIDTFNQELEKGITEEERAEFFRILDKIKQNLA